MQPNLNESDYLSTILNYIDTLSSQNDLLAGKIELTCLQTEKDDFLKNTKSILSEIKNKLFFLRSKIVALDKNLTREIIEEIGLMQELETLDYTINTRLSTKISRLIQGNLRFKGFSDN
jgi:hypothetical protein